MAGGVRGRPEEHLPLAISSHRGRLYSQKQLKPLGRETRKGKASFFRLHQETIGLDGDGSVADYNGGKDKAAG